MQTLLAVLLSYISLITYSVEAAPAPVWHHINGEQAKCYPRVCRAGTQVQICESGDPAGLTCVPCPDGTFMDRDTNSTDGLLCFHRDPCSENSGKVLVHYSEDPKEDNVCRCRTEYQDMNYDPRSPSATGHTCVFCKGDSRYLDAYGDCVNCPFKVETDAYNHKTCPSDGEPIGGSTVEPGVTKSPKPTKNRTGLIIGLTIGVILIIVIITVVLWRCGIFAKFKKTSKQSEQNNISQEQIGETPTDALLSNSNDRNGRNETNQKLADRELENIESRANPEQPQQLSLQPPTVTVRVTYGGAHGGATAAAQIHQRSNDDAPSTLENAPLSLRSTQSTPQPALGTRTREQLEAELRLDKCRPGIVNDLFVNSVLDSLISESLLSVDDKQRIENGVTDMDKARLLLDKIKKKPNGAVVFIDILKDEVKHLWSAITNAIVSQEEIDKYENELANS